MAAPPISPAVLAAVQANNIRFSVYILIVLSAIVIVFVIYRGIILFMRYLRTLTCLSDKHQEFFKFPNHIFGWVKKHLLYAPLFKSRHGNQMHIGPVRMGILPTRLQSLFLVGIVTMNVVLCVYGIEWDQPSKVGLTHLRNRSGTLAVVNMIPLVLMAGRNNPLIGILDVPFETFNLLHRWFGRIVVSLAVTHGVVEIISLVTGATAGKKVHPSGITIFTQTLKEERFMLWGFVAFVAMATIILTSFTSFRQAFYETFFHIHFALAALILAALWIHLDGLPQLNYLIAVTAIWATERLLRLLSLLYSNVGPTTTTASIEVLPGNAMRVHIRLARPRPIKPGQYIFLTIPSIGLLTSHPFSIAWSETLPQRPYRYTDPEKGYLTPSPTIPSTFNRPSTSISLLIRRRSGFTSRLHSKATNSPTPHLTLRALISSPHGSPHPLTSYGTTILIAGGIGITAFLPRIQHLLSAHASHTTATRRISLIWIIRSPEHLEWIRPWMSTILAMPHRRDVLRVQLFVTRPRDGREVRSPSATVSMCPGKPNVEALVGREIAGGLGAVGVGVCGPGGLRDGVRGAVRGWCRRRNVDFWEEGFGW